jgi:hypothetical protein
VTTPPHEPPPDEPQPSEPTQAAEEPPRCPRCGASHDPLQEYCLECGLRLVPLPGATITRDTVWTRESPIWLWLALAALLAVALAAGAIVALAATDDDNEAGTSVPTTGPTTTIPVLPPTTTGVPTLDTLTTGTITIGPPTTTGTTTTFPTTTTGTTGTTTTGTTTTGSGGIISWPARDGYTVVLRSTPTSQGRGPAESTAQQARNNGLPEVGILESSDYSSLNPGYYVTFTGVYDSENEAENALPRARTSGFPTAYVREVAD